MRDDLLAKFVPFNVFRKKYTIPEDMFAVIICEGKPANVFTDTIVHQTELSGQNVPNSLYVVPKCNTLELSVLCRSEDKYLIPMDLEFNVVIPSEDNALRLIENVAKENQNITKTNFINLVREDLSGVIAELISDYDIHGLKEYDDKLLRASLNRIYPILLSHGLSIEQMYQKIDFQYVGIQLLRNLIDEWWLHSDMNSWISYVRTHSKYDLLKRLLSDERSKSENSLRDEEGVKKFVSECIKHKPWPEARLLRATLSVFAKDTVSAKKDFEAVGKEINYPVQSYFYGHCLVRSSTSLASLEKALEHFKRARRLGYPLPKKELTELEYRIDALKR